MPRLHADHSRLSGVESEEFATLLIDAFNEETLDTMLLYKVERRRDLIVGDRVNFQTKIFEVIQYADMQSWTAELLLGARAARPNHVGLFRFAQRYNLGPLTATDTHLLELQRMVRPELDHLDPMLWARDLLALLGRICRVEIAATPIRGTGFLVGPDLVLTNHHVIKEVIAWQQQQDGIAQAQGQTLPPRLLKCCFDLAMGTDNMLECGTRVGVHGERWLVDYSPDSDAPYDAIPAENLDYALLRLAKRIGNELTDEAEQTTRGWIKPLLVSPELSADTPLFILGHPLGSSLKLSLDTNSVIGTNAAAGQQSPATRIRYRTNAQVGSSGSPCFTADWTLVAIHHAGEEADTPTFNEGIPVAAIVRLWQQRMIDNSLKSWQLELLEGLLSG